MYQITWKWKTRTAVIQAAVRRQHSLGKFTRLPGFDTGFLGLVYRHLHQAVEWLHESIKRVRS